MKRNDGKNNFKKISMLVFLLCCLFMCSLEAQAIIYDDDYEEITNYEVYGNFQYITLEDGTISIENYKVVDGSGVFPEKVTIPSTIQGKKVVRIGVSAFSYLPSKEVIIPNTVTTILDMAFRGSYIEKMVIPDSVTEMGYEVFYRCNQLQSVTLSKNLERIGEYSFYSCLSLAQVVIPEGVKTIGYEAFSGCDKILSISLPNSLTKIESGAFDCCYGLKAITIPDNVSIIESGVFSNCQNLKKIKIPSKMTEISDELFSGCTRLTSYTIPNSIIKIGESAFSGCVNLKTIVIPDKVIEISDYAFSDCDNLRDVTIPLGVIIFGKDVFDEKTNLIVHKGSSGENYALVNGLAYKYISAKKGKKYTISNGIYKVTSVKKKTVTFVGLKNKNKRKVTVPSTIKIYGTKYKVTKIAAKAFKGNKKVTKITIGKNVVTIGKQAFMGCKKLKMITIHSMKLKSVGKQARKNSPAKIWCHPKKKEYYRKLFDK